MDWLGVDWSDGWAGNVTAEVVGMVGGLVLAVLVADRVVRFRLSRERQPATDRMVRRFNGEIRRMYYAMAAILRIKESAKVTVSDDVLEQAVLKAFQTRFPLEGTTLNEAAERNVQVAAGFPDNELEHLAQTLIASVGSITAVADRYANVLGDVPKLQALVGDLEEQREELERSSRLLSASTKTPLAQRFKFSFLTDCTMIFASARQLREHLAGRP